jgi:transposase
MCDAYRIEEHAKENRHVVLWLPLFNCDLNMTELVWAQAKPRISTKNKDFRTSEMERLTKEGFASVEVDNWISYVTVKGKAISVTGHEGP